MKTHILRLEPHDDVISALEKMSWGQAGRILLVWPERSRSGAPGRPRPLTRRLDLILMQRRSDEMGAQLALVCRDPGVRFHARQLSIPVFKTLDQAQRKVWRARRSARRPAALSAVAARPRPDLQALRSLAHPAPAAWQTRLLTRLGFLTLGVLALLSIAAVLLPGAEIRLTPQTRTQSVLLDVQASPDYPSATLTGQVPIHLATVEVEGRDQLRSTGTVTVPFRQAVGRILLTNLTADLVQVPAGTVVRSQGPDPARFIILEAGAVPAGRGQNLSLPIRAILPGESGNLVAGQLQTIEGSLGLSLAASNSSPTAGGADQKGPSPGPDDYGRLYDRLAASLRQTALQELSRQIHSDDLLLPDTLVLVHVVERTYDPAEAQASDWLQLNLRLQFQAQVASGVDLRRIASGVLDQSLPDGYQAASGGPKIENLAPPKKGAQLRTTGGVTRWQLRAERQIQGELPETQAIQLALGRSRPFAEQALSAAFHLAAPAHIDLTPTWWPRLPYVPFRIVVINQDGGH